MLSATQLKGLDGLVVIPSRVPMVAVVFVCQFLSVTAITTNNKKDSSHDDDIGCANLMGIGRISFLAEQR